MNKHFVSKLQVLAASLILLLWAPKISMGKPEEQKLDIFVNGKEYSSFKDYKQARLNKIKEAVAAEKLKEADNKENIVSSASNKNLSENDLKTPLSSPKTDAQEMQELLNKMMEKHTDNSAPLTVDPNKIKTIKITPHKSHTVEIPHPRLNTVQNESHPSRIAQEGEEVPELSVPK